MSKILISVRFFVGAKAMSGRDINLKDMQLAPNRMGIDEYTVINCQGYYKGKPEKSVIIEVHMDLSGEKWSGPKECVSEINKLNNLANDLRCTFDQEVVIAEVVVRSHSKRVEWSHWSTADSGKVFPFPAHIASLLWDGRSARNDLDIPGMLQNLTRSAKVTLDKRYMPYDKWPLFVVRPRNTLILDLKEIGDKEKCKEFDDGIVKHSTENLQKLDDVRAIASGDYIARFRTASFAPIFFVTNLADLLTPSDNETPRIEINEAPFRDCFGCCEMAYLDLLEDWLLNGEVKFDRFKFLSCKRPMVTVLAITFPPKDDSNMGDTVVVQRRAANVSIYPNHYTCAPWGYLEPLLRKEPSVVDIFLQELDEELFRGPDPQRDYDSLIRRLGNLEGTLQYLGYAVDLLRPRIDILLMFKPSEVWWKRHKSRVHLNWEFKSEAKELQDVKKVATGAGGDYVPATVAAARLAMKVRANGG